MQWLVNDRGSWTIEDPNSVDTAVSFNGIDALQHADYLAFRRNMMAIGSEAVVQVLTEACREPFECFDWIESADDHALAQIADLPQGDLHTLIRAAFTLRAGFVDRLERDARQWLRCRKDTAEKDLGREAFRVINACRQLFGFGWRGIGGGLKNISAAY